MLELPLFAVVVVAPYVITRGVFELYKFTLRRRIKKLIIKKSFKLKSEDICVICQDDYNNDKCVQLYCNHKYHKKCIIRWLNEKLTCPLCNQNIKLKNGNRLSMC